MNEEGLYVGYQLIPPDFHPIRFIKYSEPRELPKEFFKSKKECIEARIEEIENNKHSKILVKEYLLNQLTRFNLIINLMNKEIKLLQEMNHGD